MARVWKSVNQQISILQSRGMKFRSIDFAKEVLSKNNYYNIVNAFKSFFLLNEDPETYINNIYFEEVYSIYVFDKQLRILFLKYMLIVESELRRHIAYEFAHYEGPEMWNNVSSYNYNSDNQINVQRINNLISKINADYVNSHKYEMIDHFLNLHEIPPIWALVNAFDFGTLRTFYFNLKHTLKEIISRNYYNIDYGTLKTFLSSLNMYRNVCAHDYRILFYRIHDADKQISDTNIHSNLNIIMNQNAYIRGKNDLFSIVIVFKYLLSKEDFRLFFISLKSLIKTLKKNLSAININQIYDSIGFPRKNNQQKSWKEIENC